MALINSIHQTPSVIERLCAGTFVSKNREDHLNKLEAAAIIRREVEPLLKELKLHKPAKPSAAQLAALERWASVKTEAVQVDEFTETEYHHQATRKRDSTPASETSKQLAFD